MILVKEMASYSSQHFDACVKETFYYTHVPGLDIECYPFFSYLLHFYYLVNFPIYICIINLYYYIYTFVVKLQVNKLYIYMCF